MNPLDVLYSRGRWLAGRRGGRIAGRVLAAGAACLLHLVRSWRRGGGRGRRLVAGLRRHAGGHSRRCIRDHRRRTPATAGHQPGRGVRSGAGHRRGGDRLVRAPLSRACPRHRGLPGGLQPGAARLPGRPDRGRHGDVPGGLGVDEPGVLPGHPAPPAQRRGGPRRVLVPGPVRDRLPADRGGVRDPVRQDPRHPAGRDGRPQPPGAWRLARRRLPARPGRVRVQGRARPAARLAARSAPRRPGGRVRVPVRRRGQPRRLRHRPVRFLAAARRRGVARPGHHGRRGGHRRHRHPVRDAGTRTSSGSWPIPRSRTPGSS